MLSFRVDQFEFEDPGTEETLEIDVSRKTRFPHPDVGSFVATTVGVEVAAKLPLPQPLLTLHNSARVVQHLKRFAGIDATSRSNWPTYVLPSESPDEEHVVICAPDSFVRYHWSTSA